MAPELDALERRIDELEGVADTLGDVPDGKLVETLEEAVGLLEEINAGIEARLAAVGQDADETGDLLDAVDFGPFDEALEELERRERSAGEPGA